MTMMTTMTTMMMVLITWIAKARRSSSKDSTEQTLVRSAATSTTLFVASSHFFDTKDNSGNNGCLQRGNTPLNSNRQLAWPTLKAFSRATCKPLRLRRFLMRGYPKKGIARILHWGHKNFGARIDGAEGVGIGEGVSPPQPTRGFEGASWAPPAGSEAELRPPTHFWHIWGPQNTSGRKNSVTLLNKAGPSSQQSQFFCKKNSLNRRLEAWPLSPLWLRPCIPIFGPLAEGRAPRTLWLRDIF